jgi:predicted phage terminase large subunit-like protein
MIFLPPRHSKSMTVTESFPSWFIGRNPKRSVIEVSYGDALAQKFGRENRRKIEEYGKSIFNIEMATDNHSATNWSIKGHRGGMISTGIGGPITGSGADCLIIDDPIKNRAEANSLTYREMIWSEYKSTLRTRLQANGIIILILTRWHEDDLAGRILASEGGNEWTIISLPAEAEENDPLGRAVGEPLWQEGGFDSAWLKETKRDVGSQDWIALYQQRPSPEEGDLLKRGWWKFYKAPPAKFDEVLQSWDCSFKDLDSSDYVVGQVWGRVGADKYLLDQVRGKLDIVSTMSAVTTLSAKWPQTKRKLIEDKANGPAVIQMLKHSIPGLIAVEPEGGKVVRVQAARPEIEAGNVYLPDPEQSPWVHDYIEECAAFPNGKNDDQVDSTSQALLYFAMYKPARVYVSSSR